MPDKNKERRRAERVRKQNERSLKTPTPLAESSKSKTQAFRRNALLGGIAFTALGAAALVFGVCKTPNSSENIPHTSEAILETYVPYLQSVDPHEQGEYSTPQSQVLWFNYSASTFNEDSARTLQMYFEDLAAESLTFNIAVNSGNIQRVRLNHEDYSEKVLFILDPKIPYPDTLGRDSVGTDETYKEMDGFTSFDRSKGKIISFVRFRKSKKPDFNNSEDVAESTNLDPNKQLTTELCQASVQADSQDSEFNPVADELICSSLSYAVYFRKFGQTYDSYNDFLNSVRYTIGVGENKIYLHPYPVPRNIYNTIPQIDDSIK